MSILENIALNMNIANNTSGTQKGSGSFASSKNEVLKDMALKLLEALSQGDSNMSLELKAQVRDIMQNQVILTLPDASELSGRTETLLPLSIGDNASFKASLNPEGQLTLSLLSTDNGSQETQITTDNPLVKKALAAANIPTNPRSLQVTSELLNAGQAVNTTNIRKFISLSIKNPDIPVKELVLLDANKVPLTQENLSAFREIAQGATVWDKEVVSQANPQQSSEVQTGQPSSENISAHLPEKTVLPESAPPATTSLPTSDITPEVRVHVSADIPAKNAEDFSSQVLNPESPTPAPTSDLPFEANYIAEDTQELAAPSTEPPTTDKQPLPIEPKDFSEEAVKKFYGALKQSETSAASSSKAASSLPENQPLPTEKLVQEATEKALQGNVQNSSTADKLQFMQDINNVFPFIQIPVKLQEENAKGELYVFEKKKKYNPDEPLTAVLHLELDSLGTTDIKVSLFKNKVSALFEVAGKDAVKFFRDEMDSLTERLTKLGFTFDSDFKVKEPDSTEKPLLYQFLEAHTPKNYSRYTFDVHA